MRAANPKLRVRGAEREGQGSSTGSTLMQSERIAASHHTAHCLDRLDQEISKASNRDAKTCNRRCLYDSGLMVY